MEWFYYYLIENCHMLEYEASMVTGILTAFIVVFLLSVLKYSLIKK